MPLISAIVVFMTSLLALPMSYVLNSVSQGKNQLLILISGCVAIGIVSLIPWLILRQRLQKVNSIYYVLALLAYSSVMSLIIALENDGLIAEFMGVYLKEGEPYLKTAHGTMMCYWDGIAHYAMYLMMLAAVSWNQSFHDVGLYWAGSFGYSKMVLFLAVMTGKDGMRWPFLLTVPYIILCGVLCASFIERKFEEVQNIQRNLAEEPLKNKSTTCSIWRRPLDLCLFLYFMFAITMTFVRFSCAMQGNFYLVNLYRDSVEPYLTDPSLYSRAQMMVQVFYFVPYYVINMYALLHPCQPWLLPLTVIFAGAAGQAQFSLIGASFHYRTPYLYRLPQTALARGLFWCINGLQFLVPQFMANSCLSSPGDYLKPLPPSPSAATSANNNGHHETVSLSSRRGSANSNHSVRMKKAD